MVKGKVYLIGAGPGRPDLITLRGLNILEQADVVIYDYLARELLKYAKNDADLVMIDAAKRGEQIVIKAREGKKVVRLKGGDPTIFSRFSEEIKALSMNKIEFEIVPGVTAACAAASYSGIPLTDRNISSTITFVTGQEDTNKKTGLINWDAVSKAGTLAFYMSVDRLSQNVKRLIACRLPLDTPAAMISNIGSIEQKQVFGNLGDIVQKVKEANIKRPAVFIVGGVAKNPDGFNWFKNNRRILFTGLSDERYFLKGNYFHLPLIEIKPLGDYKKFDRDLMGICGFDWVVFASRYGVQYFFDRLKRIGFDSRSLAGIKIAAVGNSTKNKLLEYGIKADLVPGIESSGGLIKTFKKINLKGKRIFMPRSNLSDKGLEAGFKKLGAGVISQVAYKNVLPKNLPKLDLEFFNEIIFTSPSTVRNFRKVYGRVPKGIKASFIGEVTKREYRS